MLRSANPPAGITTFPVTAQLVPDAAWQLSAESVIAPGTPVLRVIVIVAACSEKAVSRVAVHPSGIQASTVGNSFALWVVLFSA